jgi:hypothetical protein
LRWVIEAVTKYYNRLKQALARLAGGAQENPQNLMVPSR